MTDIIEIERVMPPADATELVGQPLEHRDANITREVVFTEGGQPVAANLRLSRDMRAALRRAVLGLGFTENPRASGMNSSSRNFGYSPRRPVYSRDGCRSTGVSFENPDAAATLARCATVLQDMLAGFAPDQAASDAEVLAQVDDSWRLGDQSLWTSGVINRSSRLPYHRDSFNFPTWSAMPVLRRGMRGGHLHLPEYDLTFDCADGYVVFFAGHELVHGVTPMRPVNDDGYRYSVVYYALKGMKDCYTHAVETEYANRRRTEREREMARRVASGEKLMGADK